MKMQKYIKENMKFGFAIDLEQVFTKAADYAITHKRTLKTLCVVFVLFLTIGIITQGVKEASVSDISSKFAEISVAAAASPKSVIAIPSGTVKANPFVPYRDITDSGLLHDVPTSNLVEPPIAVNENSEAARVMDTIVSGILYDKYSPSAIINIEGNDYLVKKGDVVNNYKVVNITQDSVTVRLGSNVYKAGIGEILTEGSMNHNEVANLKNKFGGER